MLIFGNFYSAKKLRRVLETVCGVFQRCSRVRHSGYNSAGSVRIRMKFGELRVYYRELALVDFGRDPRRSEGERTSFCDVNNARLYRFPVSQISRNLHTRRGSVSPWILLENIFENLPVRGLFPKRQLLGDRRQRLRTWGRDISEMITNLGKSWQVGQPTECWLSTCILGINSKSFPWPAGYVQETTFLDIAGSSVKRCRRNVARSFAWRRQQANVDVALLSTL